MNRFISCMKFLVILVILLTLIACSNNREVDGTILETNDESDLELYNDDLVFEDDTIKDLILNYLGGDWVNYYESDRYYTYVIKSIDEIYMCPTSVIPKKDFLDSIEKGEWEKENIVITEKAFQIRGFDDHSVSEFTFDFSKIENNNIDDIILHEDFYYDDKLLFSRDYVRPGKEYVKLEPAIGMTQDEALESTWGVPEKKNVTEDVYGTYEQWVYPNNQYLYFDNGLLTAIQKSE